MNNEIKKLKPWIIFFMVTLAVSGITAMPAETELQFLCNHFSQESNTGAWLYKVYQGILETNSKYPFLAYGYDWLAFAHIVIAILFIGPLRDPLKNRWVIEFGMIACVLIIPFAMVAGYFRGIPMGWRLIDCSFGVIGFIPLKVCLTKIRYLETKMKLAYETI
ncbi:MAG: hypothetical protein JST09_19245 [Bacteroidetes bacterium]|nr:hypothetical protein [Bacteroidota bacterium]